MKNHPHQISPIGRRNFLGRIAACLPILLGTGQQAQGKDISQRNSPSPSFHKHTTEPDNLFDELNDWQQQFRIPIWEDLKGNTGLLIEAIQRNEALYGSYDRYESNNQIRRITPLLLFRAEFSYTYAAQQGVIIDPPIHYGEDIVYLQAWDHDKQAQRTFHADQLSVCPTAPWMYSYHDNMSPDQWQRLMDRTVKKLIEHGIQPVS